MIDLHCHILPCIDDGAKNMEEAVKMAKIAEGEGITKIVATPHYVDQGDYPGREEVNKRISQFNEVLRKKNISVEILQGHEVYMTPDTPALIRKGLVNTINNSHYLLMELPMFSKPFYAEEVILQLKLMGIIPIIAHPERYFYMMEEPNRLTRFIELGVLFQANSESISNPFNRRAKEIIDKLIANNMIHFVASDGHSPEYRRPTLKKAYETVMKLWGEKWARELFIENPQKIIEGQQIR